MKKYFMYVAFAAAGLLTSCSSESLTAGEDPQNPTPEDRVPIQIAVATPQAVSNPISTRGAGTVGDLATGNNIWKGEKVNVYMFEKGTLTLATDGTNSLYDNVALTTPSEASALASGLANELNAAGNRVTYKYYPVKGNFDFWGYYRDDATPTTGSAKPVVGTYEVAVPFEIDGSQDLMVAKAEPTVAEIGLLASRNTDYYSAYAARKTVQPNMTFKHLLTRLTFSIVGGNNEAIGFKDQGGGVYALPGNDNIYDGVFIRSIKIRSLKTGNIIAAWIPGGTVTTGEPAQLISFTKSNPAVAADSTWMELKGKDRDAVSGKVADLYDNTFAWADKDVMVEKLKIGGTDWGKICRPTSLDPDAAVSVGGALLLAPDDKYAAEITLGQILVTEADFPGGINNPTTTVVYPKFETDINPKAPDTAFEQGKSYNVKITLYGAQRIAINTTLEAWTSGTEVPIVAE